MMNTNEIQQLILKLEKELLDIKTIQGAIKSAGGYTKDYVWSSTLQNQTLRVNFAPADSPILCYVFGGSFAVPLKISNNTQSFFFRLAFSGESATFFSNREILSVENIT